MNSDSGILKGGIYSTIIKVSIPILFGMLFELIYNISDTFFISLIDKTSSSYIASMGLIFPIIFLIIAISTGFVNGISTLIAIDVGEGNNEGVHKVFSSGIALTVVATSFILLFFGLFYSDIISFLSTDKIQSHTINIANNYFIIILIGTPFLLLSKVFQGVLQGEGKTKIIAKALSASVIINLILDPIFIFTFNLHERGAALATVSSQIIFLILMFYFSKKNEYTKEMKFNFNMISMQQIKNIAKQGIPSAIGLVVMSLSFMVFNNIVGSIGEEYLTAYTLAGRFDMVLFTPLMAINVAVTMMIGQNYGKGQFTRVLKVYRAGIIISICTLLTLAVPYIVFAKILFSQFTDVANVVNLATKQIYHITILIAISASTGFMARAYFQAIKKPLYALFLVILRLGLITIPVAKILMYIYGNRIELVWYSLMIGGITTSLTSLFLVQRDFKKISKEIK